MFIEAGYSDFRAEVGNSVTDSVAIATASSGSLYPGDSFERSLQHVLLILHQHSNESRRYNMNQELRLLSWLQVKINFKSSP